MKYNDNRNIIVSCRNRRKHTHRSIFSSLPVAILCCFACVLTGLGKMGNLVFKPHPFSNNQGFVVYALKYIGTQALTQC